MHLCETGLSLPQNRALGITAGSPGGSLKWLVSGKSLSLTQGRGVCVFESVQSSSRNYTAKQREGLKWGNGTEAEETRRAAPRPADAHCSSGQGGSAERHPHQTATQTSSGFSQMAVMLQLLQQDFWLSQVDDRTSQNLHSCDSLTAPL